VLPSFLSGLLDDTEQRHHRSAQIYRSALTVIVIAATLLIALETMPAVYRQSQRLILSSQTVLFGLLFLDFVLRSMLAGPKHGKQKSGLKSYFLSTLGAIDFVSSLPFWMNLVGLADSDLKTWLGILAFFKIARYSPALLILRDVVVSERKPLMAALYLMLLLTFTLSTLMYFVERNANPEGFQSIPHAMWWSVVTLATLGYGDVIPVTPLGKILGGIAAIMGFGMFALPAGISANGFADEIKRLRIVTNWNLVAKVPIFSVLDSGAITETNLTAAAMLGMDRATLINRRFSNYVSPRDKDLWHLKFTSLVHHAEIEKKTFMLELMHSDNSNFRVYLDCRRQKSHSTAESYRLALFDIGKITQAEAELTKTD
jgi:voltage-gated potassium channel Kch